MSGKKWSYKKWAHINPKYNFSTGKMRNSTWSKRAYKLHFLPSMARIYSSPIHFFHLPLPSRHTLTSYSHSNLKSSHIITFLFSPGFEIRERKEVIECMPKRSGWWKECTCPPVQTNRTIHSRTLTHTIISFPVTVRVLECSAGSLGGQVVIRDFLIYRASIYVWRQRTNRARPLLVWNS